MSKIKSVMVNIGDDEDAAIDALLDALLGPETDDPLLESKDASGHEHVGKGSSKGGQFTGSASADSKNPKLPEGHSKYFKNLSGAKMISLSKIKPTRARPEGIANAAKYMAAAAQGGEKRDPIKLVANSDGTYSVADGNSTFANAQANNWINIPATIVTKEELEHEAAKSLATEEKKALEKLSTAKLFSPDERKLPDHNDPPQPIDNPKGLFEHAEKTYPGFQRLLNLGKGVSAAIGGKAVYSSNAKQYKDALEEKGPVVIIAKLKGIDRSQEKVKAMGGQWNKLDDIVRATVGVDTIDDVPNAVEKLRAEMAKNDWTFSQSPYNRFENPTKVNYRDINLRVRAPNGHICEIQVNTKAMLLAKEKAHPYYEEWRTIHGTSASKDTNLSPELKVKSSRLEKIQKDLYDEGWKQSLGVSL